MVRFGINLWNWTPVFSDEHMDLIDRAAKIGFGAVEIGMNQTGFNYKEVKSHIDANGLELTLCAALTKGRDISNFDEEIRKNAKRYMIDCFKAGGKMGAKLFVGPVFAGGGKAHDLSLDDSKREWHLAVLGIREMADEASNFGITIGLEPINRYRTSVVNTAEQALRMIYDIDKPNVGILFDTYQANIEESSISSALESVLKANKLVHFHACENHRGAPGTGHIPWKDLISILKKYKYQGHLTMETFAKGGLDAGWYPLAKTQDELARIGLENLQSFYKMTI